ncbi:hypothetical protein Sdia_13100 [Streptomyces diastaticus subsp. diastaticus]|uniref:Uncharacterized protein n=1 Tax=Streptomyces diastaticus subsp. diastaticus TaxID=68040 RepID=A0ABQ1CJE6_STRDI|nr:hypothetical protein Sdia_13100 [Streptomyces diastaticus subsp. diastaticus]
MVPDQPHQPLVGPVLVTEEPGSVQGMEARHRQARRIPNVMQRGGGDKQAGVLVEDLTYFGGAVGHSLRMRPPPWKCAAEFGPRDVRRPVLDVIAHVWLSAQGAVGPSRRTR